MKKILSLILCGAISFSLFGCSSENAVSNEFVYNNFKNYIANNELPSDYYLQISQTAAESHILTEASKLNKDCAFMQYDVTGTLKCYRGGSYTILAPETYYVPDIKEAQWSDFDYEKMSEKYRNIIHLLCEMNENDEAESENKLIKSIDVSDSEDKDYPLQYSIQFNPDVIDANKLFESGGNFGSVAIKFITDKEKSEYHNISLNVQYDYNDEIFVTAVKFDTPDSPDEKGENGQRPQDIEDIFQEYVDEATASYSDYYDEYLDEYLYQ